MKRKEPKTENAFLIFALSLSWLILSSGLTQAEIPPDYISWWKFETETGGITPDETGVNNGILMGNATIINDAEKGQVLTLDGDGDYVDCGNDSSLSPTNGITISAWVKPKQVGKIDKYVISKRDSYFLDAMRSWAGADKPHFYVFYGVGSFNTASSNMALTANKWNHLVAIYDSADKTIRVYLKGGQTGSIVLADNYPINTTVNDLVIGINTWLTATSSFDGLIDDVMIYNRALNWTEIQEIYNAQTPYTGSEQPWDKPGWELTFYDEFEGDTINDTKWNFRFHWGEAPINNELQAYVDDAFELQDGILRIRADKRQAYYGGRLMNYTSGLIVTYPYFLQEYGGFEIRCKMLYGQGFWPAFWIYNTRREIDVFEFIGHDPDKVYFGIRDYDLGVSYSGSYTGPDFTKDFHTFAVEWNPQEVIWYVDGLERFRCNKIDFNIPAGELYVLANLAVGGDWPGPPDASTQFPSYYDIDYIRVYRKSALNQPPVANAGPDQSVTDSDRNGSEQVTLNGSASQDPDGNIVSFVWREGGAQIATGVKPTVTLSTGTHTITLTVTDNGGLTDTDTVTITVSHPANQPPLANAGPDQTVTDSDRNGSEQVNLDGSASSDPDGNIVSFVWTKGATQIATGIKPTVTLSTGTHIITLTVTDNGSLTDTDTVTITVFSPANQPPVANAGPDQNVTDSDRNGSEQVTLDGSGSSDPDGSIVSFVWREGAAQIATGVNPTVTLSVGTHNITLTVTDNGGLTDTDSVTITVSSSANQPPVANAGPDQNVTDSDRNGSEQVTLDGSGSSDPDGSIVSFVWREGAAQIATGVNPTVTLSVGTHNITLTVTDNGGLTDTDTVTIIVSSPANQPPLANAGPDQTVTDNDRNGSEQVTLDGSASSDPDGTIVSFVWTKGATQIATGAKPTVTLSTGTHIITLTVTDNGGLTDTDTVTIKVLKEDKEFGELPTGCYNNVINPLRGEEATIIVEIKERCHIKIVLYDRKGNKIKELADEERDAGIYPYRWDGKDDSENLVGSGLYFVHIQAGDYKKTEKIVVVK